MKFYGYLQLNLTKADFEPFRRTTGLKKNAVTGEDVFEPNDPICRKDLLK